MSHDAPEPRPSVEASETPEASAHDKPVDEPHDAEQTERSELSDGSSERDERDESGDSEEAAPAPKRLAPYRRLLLLAVALAIGALILLPLTPRQRHLRLHLGPGSSRIRTVLVRIGRDGHWDRQSSWRFPNGAPPSVHWTVQLVGSEATQLHVELGSEHDTVERERTLSVGGTELEVELAEATAQLH